LVPGVNDVVLAASDTPPDAPPPGKETSRGWLVVKVAVSVAVIVACFVYAIPKFASYSQVWTEITTMTPLQIGILVVATALNLLSYWWQNMVSIPRLGLWQAAVNNQTATTVANTMPGGGYVAVAVSYEMYRSWGFTGSAVGVSVAVTSVLNIFARLLLPAVALVLIILTGRASGALVGASVVGALLMAGLVVLFALVMWKTRLAFRIGSGLGRMAMWVFRLVRRPRTFAWGDVAVRFRRNAIDLVVTRWLALSSSTVISHLTLYLVLLLALRFVGVSNDEVSWAQVLGVFAFGRLLTALPITPGGVGVIEVAYIGGIIIAGRDQTAVPAEVFQAQVTAGVLVFRALTYAIQIPIGAITYLIWKTNKRWRKPTAAPVSVPVPVAVPVP
jgi:putative heme transporter